MTDPPAAGDLRTQIAAAIHGWPDGWEWLTPREADTLADALMPVITAAVTEATAARAERDRLDLAHLAVAAKLRDRAEKAEAERDARGVMSDSLSKALAETREALAEVVEDLTAARAAIGRVEALCVEDKVYDPLGFLHPRARLLLPADVRAALTPPAVEGSGT